MQQTGSTNQGRQTSSWDASTNFQLIVWKQKTLWKINHNHVGLLIGLLVAHQTRGSLENAKIYEPTVAFNHLNQGV